MIPNFQIRTLMPEAKSQTQAACLSPASAALGAHFQFSPPPLCWHTGRPFSHRWKQRHTDATWLAKSQEGDRSSGSLTVRPTFATL